MEFKNYRRVVNVDAVRFDGTAEMAKEIVDWLHDKVDISYIESYSYDRTPKDGDDTPLVDYVKNERAGLHVNGYGLRNSKLPKDTVIYIDENGNVRFFTKDEFDAIYSII